jgi:hypothetical protein
MPGGPVLRLLALVPPVTVALVVWRYGLDVPHMDQWELVPLLQAAAEGRLTLAQLWAPHNEHRLLVPRLVMLALARVTAWNIRYELVVGFLAALATWTLLARLVGATVLPLARPLGPWLVLALSLAVFSLTQWHNWVWGWQIQIHANVLGAATVAWSLGPRRGSVRALALALAGASLATLSFASGLLLFVLLPAALLLAPEGGRRRVWMAALALAAGLAAGAVYLAGLGLAAPSPLARPAASARYALAYLGAGLGGFSHPVAILWGGLGLVVLTAGTTLLWRRDPAARRVLPPWLLLAAYAALSAVLSAAGRLPFGERQALAPRYVTISSLFWAALVVVTAIAAARLPRIAPHSPRLVRIVRLAVAVAALLAVLSAGASWVAAGAGLRRYHAAHRVGLECVRRYAGAPDDCLRIHYPDPAVLRARAGWLAARGLSLFR